MAKLDDFLTKKKETVPILDLSRATAKSQEEFKKLQDKLPEFKIKPEKVRSEDLKIREKNFKFKSGKKDLKILKQSYAFLDPVPAEMNEVSIDELAVIPIEWKMLTLLRPKTRAEDDMFSRLVELRKLSIKTSAKDRRSYGIDPQIKKTKNKAGVVETKIITCKECGDEFCTGEWCMKFTYDSFVRVSDEAMYQLPMKSATTVPKQMIKAKKGLGRRSRSTTKSSRSKSHKKAKSMSKSREKSPFKRSAMVRSKSSTKLLKKSKSVDVSPQKSPPRKSPSKSTTQSKVKKSKKVTKINKN